MIRRMLRPSNRRVRWLVGLLLIGLFAAVQAARTDANLETRFVRAYAGRIVGQTSAGARRKLEQLARSDHVALLRRCLKAWRSRYHDFRATFVKQERIDGALGKEQWLKAAYRDRPFSVALTWTRNAPRGDRVLYVDEKYGGQMLVRPANKFLRALVPGGTVTRDPESREVMRSTLRPVTLFGFRKGLQSLLKVYRRARDAGDLRTEFGGYRQVAGRKALMLIRYLPPGKGYPCHRTEIYIDVEYLLPTCIKGYNWEGQIDSRYVYKDLEFNVGLTDRDFLPENHDMERP